MIDLKDLKRRIEERAGETIAKGSRRRKLVYYRKIYCKIGRLSGYTLQEVGKHINMSHDNVLFHARTIYAIETEHKVFFNELMFLYGLEWKIPITKLQKPKNKVALDYAKMLLSQLSEDHLEQFIDTRIKPFLKVNKYKYEYN